MEMGGFNGLLSFIRTQIRFGCLLARLTVESRRRVETIYFFFLI